MITKTVIVEVRGLPITLSDNVKAFGVHGPVDMSEKDIFTCIAKGAYVWEIKPDGSKAKLDFTNYNKVDKPVAENPAVQITPGEPKEQPVRQQQYSKQNKYNKNKHKN